VTLKKEASYCDLRRTGKSGSLTAGYFRRFAFNASSIMRRLVWNSALKRAIVLSDRASFCLVCTTACAPLAARRRTRDAICLAGISMVAVHHAAARPNRPYRNLNRIAASNAMENRTRNSHESPYGKHGALVWFVPSTKAIVTQGEVDGDLSQGQH
jgi:hypothetical protein